MKDGYVGLFVVPDEGAEPAIVSVSGDIILAEEVELKGDKVSSTALISIGTVTEVELSSGAITHLTAELRKDEAYAMGQIQFNKSRDSTAADASEVMADATTVTTNNGGTARVWRFMATMTQAFDVQIAAPDEGGMYQTMKNLYLAINGGGDATNYHQAGWSIDPWVAAKAFGDYRLLLQSKTVGTGGNTGTLTTTSSNDDILLITNSGSLYGGSAAGTYLHYATFQCVNDDGSNFWYDTTGNKGIFRIPDIAFDTIGIPYKIQVKFFNGDGQIAKNSGGSDIILTSAIVIFNGRPAELDNYAEVQNLEVANASNPEGGDTPVQLPPGGIARLTWDDIRTMALDNVSLFNHPLDDGTTGTISPEQMAQLNEYVIFMYMATTSGLPTNEYPTIDDSNGEWKMVGRTQSTFMEVQCPKNKNIGFWVGWGTKDTEITTDVPIGQKVKYSDY